MCEQPLNYCEAVTRTVTDQQRLGLRLQVVDLVRFVNVSNLLRKPSLSLLVLVAQHQSLNAAANEKKRDRRQYVNWLAEEALTLPRRWGLTGNVSFDGSSRERALYIIPKDECIGKKGGCWTGVEDFNEKDLDTVHLYRTDSSQPR